MCGELFDKGLSTRLAGAELVYAQGPGETLDGQNHESCGGLTNVAFTRCGQQSSRDMFLKHVLSNGIIFVATSGKTMLGTSPYA